MAAGKLKREMSTGGFWPISTGALNIVRNREYGEEIAGFNGEVILGADSCLSARAEQYCQTLLIGSGSLVHPNCVVSLKNTGETPPSAVIVDLKSHVDRSQTAEVKRRPEARPAYLLAMIKSNLNLNISQLARVFDVGRPTIYKWLDGTIPRRDNWQRLSKIANLARNYQLPHTQQCSRFLDSPDEDGRLSVLDALAATNLDTSLVESRLNSILGMLQADKKESIASQLKKQGFGELSEDSRKTTLAPFVRKALDDSDE